MALVFHRTRSTNTSHCTLDIPDAGISADREPAKKTKMQVLPLILVASALTLLLPAVSLADPAEELNDMSPEQRREYVQGLSEDERRAHNRAAMREHWENMSEEERAAARQPMREQRDMQKGKHKDGGEGRGNGRAARQRP